MSYSLSTDNRLDLEKRGRSFAQSSQIVPSPSNSSALSPISPTNWSDEEFVLLTPKKVKQEVQDMLDINLPLNYNNYYNNEMQLQQCLPNRGSLGNASQINARNVFSGGPNMPFAGSVYADSERHSPQWLCHVKRETDELDYNNISSVNTINGSVSTVPVLQSMYSTRVKQEVNVYPPNLGDCYSSSTSNSTPTPNGAYLAQIQNLALKECTKEIDVACVALGISADPFNWSIADVRSWLVWTQRQFNLQPFPLEYFNMDGMTLCSLNESDFKQRAPHCGEILHAQLDIWKTAVEFRPEESILEFSSILNSWSTTPPASPIAASVVAVVPNVQTSPAHEMNTSCLSPLSPPLCSSPINTALNSPNSSTTLNSPKPGHPSSIESGIVTSDYGSEGAQSDDDISDDGCDLTSNSNRNTEQASASTTSTGGRSGSGSHIHLWQFLKELLSQPQLYGSCIRWLDRPKGIFKIEDSVRVARLWGKRKNRPAMNYDKLSRSIRQYYKKGIMKKTERSQRLVYQFCHPYCL